MAGYALSVDEMDIYREIAPFLEILVICTILIGLSTLRNIQTNLVSLCHMEVQYVLGATRRAILHGNAQTIMIDMAISVDHDLKIWKDPILRKFIKGNMKLNSRGNLIYHVKHRLGSLLHQQERVEAIVILQNVTVVDGLQVSKVTKYNLRLINHWGKVKLETKALHPRVHSLIYSLSKCRKISLGMILIRRVIVLKGLGTEVKVVIRGEMKVIRRNGGQKVIHLRKVG